MATTELVAVTIGASDYSADQTVGAGEVHTLIPIFQGRAGKVAVEVKNSDASYQLIGTLTSRPSSNKVWQVQGPLEYRVGVRNAGCDVDTGA